MCVRVVSAAHSARIPLPHHPLAKLTINKFRWRTSLIYAREVKSAEDYLGKAFADKLKSTQKLIIQ